MTEARVRSVFWIAGSVFGSTIGANESVAHQFVVFILAATACLTAEHFSDRRKEERAGR